MFVKCVLILTILSLVDCAPQNNGELKEIIGLLKSLTQSAENNNDNSFLTSGRKNDNNWEAQTWRRNDPERRPYWQMSLSRSERDNYGPPRNEYIYGPPHHGPPHNRPPRDEYFHEPPYFEPPHHGPPHHGPPHHRPPRDEYDHGPPHHGPPHHGPPPHGPPHHGPPGFGPPHHGPPHGPGGPQHHGPSDFGPPHHGPDFGPPHHGPPNFGPPPHQGPPDHVPFHQGPPDHGPPRFEPPRTKPNKGPQTDGDIGFHRGSNSSDSEETSNQGSINSNNDNNKPKTNTPIAGGNPDDREQPNTVKPQNSVATTSTTSIPPNVESTLQEIFGNPSKPKPAVALSNPDVSVPSDEKKQVDKGTHPLFQAMPVRPEE